MKKLNILAAIVIATLVSINVSAQSTTTTTCLSASQDTFIHEFDPTTNYGSAMVIQPSRWTYSAGGGSGFFTTKVLNQFDLSTLPSGATITSAIMKLHVDVTDPVYNQHRDLSGGTGNGATIQQIGTSWTESTVTWVSAPTSFLSSTTIPSLGNGSIADVVVDVTTMVQNMHSTGINNGFLISMTDNSDYYHSLVFGSKENTNPIYQPELCVTYTVPCDPWTLCGNTTTATDFLGTINPQPLNFKTNNIDRAVITASGNMGLGTMTPTGAALHIVTGSNTGMLLPAIKLDRNDGTNQAGLLTVGISGNGFTSGLLGGGSAFFKLEDPYLNSANRDMGFSTNGAAAQFVIKNNGFIGAGTETPTANFHSVGTARLQSLPSSTTNATVLTTDASGNISGQLASSLAWSLSGNAASTSDFIGTTNSNPLNFRVNNIKSMSLDNGGNLSISTGGISTYQKLYVETNKQNDGIQVNQTGTTAATLDLNASGGSGKRWALHSTGSGNSQGAGHLLFWDWTTNQEQMRIDTNGKVVMGNVSTPVGYKLYVAEGILTEKVKVALASSFAWADYVFADNYNLKPLSEVETFIKANKHLPNIPSADELVKDGLDLGKMQSLQMEKIEELTLYMIEMKKEIESLKKENEVLKSKN
jgi:hypothetical protein